MSTSKFTCPDCGSSGVAAVDILSGSDVRCPDCGHAPGYITRCSKFGPNLEILLHPSKYYQAPSAATCSAYAPEAGNFATEGARRDQDPGRYTGITTARRVDFDPPELPDDAQDVSGGTDQDSRPDASATSEAMPDAEAEELPGDFIDPKLRISRNKAPLIVVGTGAFIVLISLFLPWAALNHGVALHGDVLIRFKPFLLLCSLIALVASIRFSFSGSKAAADFVMLDGFTFLAWTIHSAGKAAGPALWTARAGCAIVLIGGILVRFSRSQLAERPASGSLRDGSPHGICPACGGTKVPGCHRGDPPSAP